MTQDEIEQAAGLIMLTTLDPDAVDDGRPMPALTTLLHRVCRNDQETFTEASRLVVLFIQAALAERSPADLKTIAIPRDLIEAAGKAILERRGDPETLDRLREIWRDNQP